MYRSLDQRDIYRPCFELTQTRSDPRDPSYKRESEKASERYRENTSAGAHYEESVFLWRNRYYQEHSYSDLYTDR